METNPLLLRLWRNGELESMHRGVWALVDTGGVVIDGAGDADQLIFPRSATKSLQALPVLESGAFDRFGLSQEMLALALSSHSGEPMHEEVAAAGLARLGLDESSLRCGPQRPFGAAVSEPPRRITNNCSGKHVGFLALARHVGDEPDHYLDPHSQTQRLVRAAVADMVDVDPTHLGSAVDGCSAPTFRMPVSGLALGLARMTNPDDLDRTRRDACRRITGAGAEHPALVAGTHERFCTDLLVATGGRVFGKIGAEGVYALGVVDAGIGMACKIDDGNARGAYALIVAVLLERNLISADEAEALSFWGGTTRRNWDGIDVGRFEVVGR